MTEAFGWSRTALSGAVSLGGLLAAIASPFLGPFLDRNGARAVLTFAVIGSGVAAILLSRVRARTGYRWGLLRSQSAAADA